MAESYEILEGLKKEFQQVQEFNIHDVKYTRISDSNLMNYTQGQIRFDVQNLISSTASDAPLYELSESYIQLYLKYSLTFDKVTNCALGTVNAGSNARIPVTDIQGDNVNALSIKDTDCLINQFWMQLSGQEVISTPTHSYLYRLLKKHIELESNLKMASDVEQKYFVNGESMYLNAAVGEVNNVLSEYRSKHVLNLNGHINESIRQRNKRFVRPGVPGANDMKSRVLTEADCQRLDIPYMKVLNYAAVGSGVPPRATEQKLTFEFYDIAKIYLKDLDDWFKNVPSLNQIPKFNLNIAFNMSQSSQWSVTFNTPEASNFTDPNVSTDADHTNVFNTFIMRLYDPLDVSAINGNSTCCPFLVGDAGWSRNNTLETAICIKPGAAQTVETTGTIRAEFGWGNNTKTQQYLFIPHVSWDLTLLKDIVLNEPYHFKTMKGFIDITTFNNLKKGVGYKRPLNNSFTHVRNIYLIPFHNYSQIASGANARSLTPWQSCVSTAPVTNSLVYLSKIQIWMGTKPLLMAGESNFSPIDYYDNGLYKLLGTNNVLSNKSGLINKNQWMSGYHYYKFDIAQYATELTDKDAKTFEIGFDIESAVNGNADATSDVVVIVECENSWNINRFTGLFM